MHLTEIGIFKIAQTRVNWPEVNDWLKFIGIKDPHGVILQIGNDAAMDFVDLQMGAGAGKGCPPAVGTDTSALIALAGKRCYNSFEVGLNPNISKIRTDHAEYLTNVLKSGHGCYDEETEVLTRDGWKLWPEVTEDDEFATLSSGGTLRWNKATRLVRYEHKGEMYRVDSAQVDLLVTPDHNMLACKTTTRSGRKRKWEDYELISAMTLGGASHAYIKTVPTPTERMSTSQPGGMLGFAIGDGWFESPGSLHFHLRRERKILWLRAECRRLGWRLEESPDNDKYRVAVPDCYQPLFSGIYNDRKEKQIPAGVLDTWSLGEQTELLAGLMESDDSRSDTGDLYDTTSELLAGQIQRLALQLGMAANISQAPCYQERLHSFGNKPIHRLSFPLWCLRPEVNGFAGQDGRSYWVEDWEGEVFCAEVPNNTLYVRRNGKPVWSGNSVLEHASWTFAIENVSRVFTGEMNRHRAGVAISEGSMRYIRFEDVGFTVPDSQKMSPAENEEWQVAWDKYLNTPDDVPAELTVDEDNVIALKHKKMSTQSLFQRAFGQMEQWNLELSKIWQIEEIKDFTLKKKLTSMFRRIIGMGISTGGVWTMNARALRHILAMRGSVHAEEEIYHVFNRIADIMIRDEPLLFGDFTKNSEGSWVPKYPKV